jgi:hypothetical protein
MKRAEDLIPWKVTDISFRPYSGFWSMNPSVHYDGSLWLCTLRCADYSMSGGKTVRSDKAKPGESRTKNAMVVLDPTSWKPVEIHKMKERDDLSRASSGSVGYEDIRLFRTDKYGLQGIAAALHLKRGDRCKQLAEQVVLSFGEAYDIVDARPIRGPWSTAHQKNWSPFDHCAEPRFLYAIDKGILFDDHGELCGADASVRSSTRPRRANAPEPQPRVIKRARERAAKFEHEREDRKRRDRSADFPAGAVEPQGHEVLRGGTQLVRVADDAWLGIGHAMQIIDKRKFYWHVWYVVDSRGTMKSASAPMKLAPDNGIEFAAGLAIDGDRAVISFGVDDAECRLAETKLSAVLGMLKPVR